MVSDVVCIQLGIITPKKNNVRTNGSTLPVLGWRMLQMETLCARSAGSKRMQEMARRMRVQRMLKGLLKEVM